MPNDVPPEKPAQPPSPHPHPHPHPHPSPAPHPVRPPRPYGAPRGLTVDAVGRYPPSCLLAPTQNFHAALDEYGRAVWRGTLWPVPVPDELALVLADLACDRAVDVQPGGRVAHLPWCDAAHYVPRGIRLGDWRAPFDLEIVDCGAPGLPHVRCVNVNFSAYPDHPHTFPDGSLCPMHPSAPLPVGGARIEAFLDAVAIYLVKHVLWERTRKPLVPGSGLWIGSAFDHRGVPVDPPPWPQSA